MIDGLHAEKENNKKWNKGDMYLLLDQIWLV